MLYRHTALKVVPVACGQSGQTTGMFQEGEVGVDFSAEPYLNTTAQEHFVITSQLLPFFLRNTSQLLLPDLLQKPQGESLPTYSRPISNNSDK